MTTSVETLEENGKFQLKLTLPCASVSIDIDLANPSEANVLVTYYEQDQQPLCEGVREVFSMKQWLQTNISELTETEVQGYAKTFWSNGFSSIEQLAEYMVHPQGEYCLHRLIPNLSHCVMILQAMMKLEMFSRHQNRSEVNRRGNTN